MKKIILISILIFSFSCNEKSKSKTILEGTFIFFDDAAVLQSTNEIYGIYIDDKSIDLIEKAKKLKTKESDEIKVLLGGQVSTEEHDVIKWPQKFKINEIIDINVIKKKDNSIIFEEK